MTLARAEEREAIQPATGASGVTPATLRALTEQTCATEHVATKGYAMSRDGSPTTGRRIAPRSLALVALLVLTVVAASGCTPPPDPGWQLRWGDEFSVDGAPDGARWAVSDGFGWTPEESFSASPSNVRVAGGNLVVTALPAGAGKYTTGLIASYESFQSGAFEARMKFPTAAGTWPAFWLACAGSTVFNPVCDPPWPAGGEIDVVEHYAGSDSGTAYSNLHPDHDPISGVAVDRMTGTAIDVTQWHTYRVEWLPGVIRFLVDGVQTAVHRPTDVAGAAYSWPFDTVPERIWLGMQVGGQAGPPTASAYPQTLLVDYVRVYNWNPKPAA